jgi:hypothetical protein
MISTTPLVSAVAAIALAVAASSVAAQGAGRGGPPGSGGPPDGAGQGGPPPWAGPGGPPPWAGPGERDEDPFAGENRDAWPPGLVRRDDDTIVLFGRGRGFVIARFLDDEITYTVRNLAGEDINSTTGQSARIRVLATRPYALDVRFPTWRPGPPAPQGFRQAEFSDGSHRIGGRLWLDPTPDTPSNNDTVFQSPDGFLEARGRFGLMQWGLGADIAARYTDHPSGVAPAGTYSLEAVITIQPF